MCHSPTVEAIFVAHPGISDPWICIYFCPFQATPLKVFPAEEPNRTDPDDVIAKLKVCAD